ncbi:endodeoxyribonuclease [Diaporthe eres]
MSYDLSMEVDPFPSAPSGPPTSPLFSDGIDHDEFDTSQFSQSSRVITIHGDDSDHTQTDLVVSKIEEIFATMVDVLAEGGDALVIPYRRRASQREGVLRFPGSTVQEAIKFTRMMRIMELAREALVSDRLISKRNIYYQDPDLFKSQSNVDELVDDLAFTLGVGRNALHIVCILFLNRRRFVTDNDQVAASKGLLAGPLRLTMKDDTVVACSFDQDPGETIPPINTVRKIDFGETRWILVIEKEVHARFAAIEGKGYADLATLEFLNLIHSARPLLPILGVFDCDPHGIEIMRTYKYGSQRLSHEENARVPGLQWLGVKIDDILRANPPSVEEDGSQSSLGQASQSSQSSFGLLSQGSQGSAPSGKQKTIQRA